MSRTKGKIFCILHDVRAIKMATLITNTQVSPSEDKFLSNWFCLQITAKIHNLVPSKRHHRTHVVSTTCRVGIIR